MLTVYTKEYTPPPPSLAQILAYMGSPGENRELEALVLGCIRESERALCYKVCYAEMPVEIHGDTVNFGFATVRSPGLSKHLCGCRSAIIFAATLGIELDRLIAKSSVSSQVRELAFSALGAERIEALCDTFCREASDIKRTSGLSLTRRFSPGYSDLPLAFQKDIFSLLQCSKNIGLTLNDSMLMSPSKSVSAIVGVRNM